MAEPQKRALITGITGQDGRYLAELLLKKDYKVYGLVRVQNNPKRSAVERETPAVKLITGDLTDMGSLVRALEISQPHEVYNLAAVSFVASSFIQPEVAYNVSGQGALRLLEAVRIFDGGRGRVRYYQASTSELFGAAQETPQTELTPFRPSSPYGLAKAYAHHMTVGYRERYGLHASCGILYNHESPRRGHQFVTRKVTSTVARIKLGLEEKLLLGNLDSQRDWGFAGDYVRGMWLTLQQNQPGDYILATGETHSISELLDAAFGEVGIKDWKPYVEQDPQLMRPTEVNLLRGDPSKARQRLGWEAEVKFRQLIAMMVKNDLETEEVSGRYSSL
jgi:GDPmannose 4,6-dehydratase